MRQRDRLEVRVDQVLVQHDQHVWDAHVLGGERCRDRRSRLSHAPEFSRCRLHGLVWDHELHVQVRVDIGLTRGERAADQHAQKIRLAHGVPADGLQPPSVKREFARPGGKGEVHRRAL
jgi:hypothetical protein